MNRPAATAHAPARGAPTSPPPPAPRNGEGGRLAKFATVGAVNTIIDSATFALLTILGTWYPLAKLVAFTIATANGYFWNRRWTFQGRAAGFGILARYLTVQISTFLLNVALLALAVERGGLHPLEAQVICLPVTFGLAYLGQRLWTFRGHLHAPHRHATQEEHTVGPL